MIGQAQTGTGKTAAFGLPMIQYVDPDEHDVQALVLTPTRELCIQVTQALRAYGARKGIDVGRRVRRRADPHPAGAAARRAAQIVVGTVGRVLDLISRHSLMLHSCRYVVLDEADEMLDLGFLEDVEKILSLTPGGRQTALFSATMPPEIRALAERHLYDPVTVKVKAATLTIDTVEQFYARDQAGARRTTRSCACSRPSSPSQAIVFVRTKIRCEQLYRTLRDKGMNVKALHGDMSQGSRDGVMISFKGGRVPILVATDVAARGLDISSVTHIVNFDVPTSPDVYVHRIGRTGRVGRSGRAITFVEPRQKRDARGDRAPRRTRRSRRGPRARTSRPAPRQRAARAATASRTIAAATTASRYAQADRRRGGRAAGLEEADLSTPSPPAPGLDGEASATSGCSSASRCSRCPAAEADARRRGGRRHRGPRPRCARAVRS